MPSTDFNSRYGAAALVTGASSGIGRAFAEQLAAKGMELVLVARRINRLDSLAAQLRATHGVRVTVCQVDLSETDAVHRILGLTSAIDVGLIVSNAGYSLQGDHSSHDARALTAMLMVNCNASMQLANGFIPRLRKRGRGGIIFVSSVESLMGVPYSAAYSSSKAFVKSLGEALWAELHSEGIEVLTICPGATDTEALGRHGIDPAKLPNVMSPDEVVTHALGGLKDGPVLFSSEHYKATFDKLLSMPRRDALMAMAKSRKRQNGGSMAHKFVAEELIDAACKSTGLQRFDSDSFREGLGILLADANKLDYPEAGVKRLSAAVVAALATRLKTAAYLEKRPELLQRPVKRPVFVFGIPRTGTTLLSNLLAADPARRSPLTWEVDDPVPPATTATLYNDPRALARLEQERKMLAANPDMGKYYRNSAIYPNECMFFIQSDFKALIWEGRGKLQNYRDWLFNDADLTSTYRYHKRFLQLLQADAPGVWNLKQPSHGLWLETLLKEYPDARLVWTHRDPIAATASFCSLMRMGSGAFGVQTDMAWLGENYPWQAVQHADRIMNSRDKLAENRIIDVHYADLMRNPIPTMRTLYSALGDDFTAEAEAAMSSWLAENPQGKFGKHEYALGQFGLSADQIRSKFERYLARYHVEAEG